MNAIYNCGREYPSPLLDEHKERAEWKWVPCEMRTYDEQDTDTVSLVQKGKPLSCGYVSDNEKLILLCPTCLRTGGREW